MIERDVKGVVHGVDIQAEHLTEDAAVHETTKDQEAEKEGEAGTCARTCVCVCKYFRVTFQNVKILWRLDLSAWVTSLIC